MELKEAVQALSEHSKEAVSSALQEHSHPLWQHVHDIGFALANDRAKDQLKEAEQKLTDATRLIEERDTRITEIESKQPDLEAERQSHKDAVERLEAKHKTEVTNLGDALGKSRRRSVLQELTLELKGLNPVYAEVAAEHGMKRVVFKDEGLHDVMQESQIPFVAANGKTPIQLLAAEIIAGAPKELVNSNVDRGAGGTDDSAGKGGKDSPVWDQLRAKGKEAAKADSARLEKVTSMFGPRD